MSKKHKPFYDKMLKLWEEHGKEIMELSNKYGLGKEQTVWNLMIKKHNIEYELLPYKWNMTCMPKKEILDNHLYSKLGWIYHYNGLEGKDRGVVNYSMERSYRYLNENK
jgi:hypothetical protein